MKQMVMLCDGGVYRYDKPCEAGWVITVRDGSRKITGVVYEITPIEED